MNGSVNGSVNRTVNGNANGRVHVRENSQTGIKCLYTNADILQNKMLELNQITLEQIIDLVAITEILPKKKKRIQATYTAYRN